MYVLQCDITIGGYRFRQVNKVMIERSWRTLGDTALIRLPRVRTGLEGLIREGDRVTVRLGYAGVYEGEEFNGYVREISPNVPIEIRCEDALYHFKRTPISRSWRKVTLKEVLRHLVTEVNRGNGTDVRLSDKVPDIDFGRFRIAEVTAAAALSRIKEKYMLTVHFDGNELYAGLAYQDRRDTVRYSLARNVISSDLTYKREETVKFKVRAIAISPDGEKMTETIGDEKGEERTLMFYNVPNRSDLRKIAAEELKKLKFTGFEGDITTFLYPFARYGMVADLTDPEDRGRSGRYYIDTVTTNFGQRGARRKVELGIRVS